MKKTNEKGITLMALVITIIVLLILAGIVGSAGNDTYEYSKYKKLQDELILIQNKVNELNKNNEMTNGYELTTQQKAILDSTEVSNIIYKNKTNEQKTEIENGFRYFSNRYIKEKFNLDGIDRGYLINVENRFVVSEEGLEYEGITYYMLEQMGDGAYNIQYENKNTATTGDYQVNTTKEEGRWKIEITNIQYNGYINNWTIQYRSAEEEIWKTANSSVFYLTKPGNYYVQVIHDDINLGSQLVSLIDDENLNVVE